MNKRGALGASFPALLGFSVFFLVRPFLDEAPAYRPRPAGTTYAYSFLVVAAFLPYALAVWAANRGVSLRAAIAGAVVLHLVLLPAAITQSQDLYAYLFYGKMWAVYGANPYLEVPMRFASDSWFPYVRWPDQPSVYGPVWTLLTAGVVRVSSSSLAVAFGLTKALVGLITLGAVVGLARASSDPARTIVLFAWNPLVLVSLPLGGHADGAVAALLVWALLADRRKRPALAAGLLATATLVKAYAGIALLVYLLALVRRRRGLAPAVAVSAGLALLTFAPLWGGLDTFQGLTGIAGRESASLGGTIETGIRAVLLAAGAPAAAGIAEWVVRIAGLAVIAVVVARVYRSDGFDVDPWPAAATAFAAYVVVTPWFLYWHLVGLLALAAVAASAPVRGGVYTFSGTSMLTASFGLPWGWAPQTVLRYGIPFAVARRAARFGRGQREDAALPS